MRRTPRLFTVTLLAAAALVACNDDTGPSGAGFRVLWPSATVLLHDSATLAVAIFTAPFPQDTPPTFSAFLDNGSAIPGVRQDSVVAFPLRLSGDGTHQLTLTASTGPRATQTFTYSFLARPRIADVTPVAAPPGAASRITILGERFTADLQRVRVLLNGVSLPVAAAASDSIVVTLSAAATLYSGLLTVEVDGRSSPDLVQFQVTGSQPSTAPQIFLLLPTAGPAFIPVGIAGTNFDQGTIPFVGGTPALSLFNFSTQNLPLLGTITIGFTIVPPAAPRGAGDVKVRYFGQTSNAFPFTVN